MNRPDGAGRPRPRPGLARSLRRATAAGLTAVVALAALGCGYHLASKGSSLPAHVKAIGVLPFENRTTRSELGQRVTENVLEQLVSRKYHVSTEARDMDGVIRGTIASWNSRPVQLSEEGSDAQRVSVTLTADVVFEDRVLGRVTWKQDDYRFTSEYDVVGDPDEYFDTELEAVEEVAADFSRAIVSAILQGF